MNCMTGVFILKDWKTQKFEGGKMLEDQASGMCLSLIIYIRGSRDTERCMQSDHPPHKDFGCPHLFCFVLFCFLTALSNQKTRYQSTVKGGSWTFLPFDVVC